MNKFKLLDLFCGAGGAAMGYYLAGFKDITGVDNKIQKNYPFKFILADAFEYLKNYGNNYDVIHASPPCQRYAKGTPDKTKHPDLLPLVRKLLIDIGRPWIIENVPGAPMRGDIRICGCMVGLPLLKRVRLFETFPAIFALLPSCNHMGPVITVTGTGVPSGTIKSWKRLISHQEMKDAMGINWMSRKELSQAIPPAYTELIGRKVMEILGD